MIQELHRKKPRIGLALGSGSARGWSHIGVIQELSRMGIHPDILCGTSIGALVAATHACGHLQELESWLRQLSMREMIKLIDLSLVRGGLIEGNRLIQALCRFIDDIDIASLPMPYGAVATDLTGGREFWFRDGSLLTAVRSSTAIPALFPPVTHQEKWLIDGGLVNPVPVSLCRAMGADIVIAVNLNSELVGNRVRGESRKKRLSSAIPQSPLLQNILTALSPIKERMDAMTLEYSENEKRTPNIFEVMTGSIDIMQDRITKSRLAGDPPEVLISPHLAHMGLLEFDRADEAIEEGVLAVRSACHAGAFKSYLNHTEDRD